MVPGVSRLTGIALRPCCASSPGCAVTLLALLRDEAARIDAAEEALEVGDTGLASLITAQSGGRLPGSGMRRSTASCELAARALQRASPVAPPSAAYEAGEK